MGLPLRWSKSPGLLIAGLTALSLGILGTSTWLMFRPAQETAEQVDEAASAPTAERNVTALGRIEPEGGIYNIAPPSGALSGTSRVMQLLIQEGDTVTRGQPLALMDSYAGLQAQVLQAQANLAEAEASFKKVRAGAQKSEIDAQDAAARATEFAAQTQQAAITSQSAAVQAQEEEIDRLEAQAERVAAEGRKAVRDANKFRQLARDGAISEIELDTQELALEAKVHEMEQAKQAIERAKAERDRALLQLNEAGLRFEESKEQLNRSQAEARTVSNVPQTDLALAQAQVDVARAALQRSIIDLETNGGILSPIDGQVLKIHSDVREAVGTKGVLDLARTQVMNVIAEVYETDVRLIRVGQTAMITSPVLEQPLLGKVGKVGLQINKKDVLDSDPVADTDARVIEVEIRLDNPEAVRELTNLQVNVEIDT